MHKLKELIKESETKKYGRKDIEKLVKLVDETMDALPGAIWALKDGSKEQEQFVKINNILNDFRYKYLKKLNMLPIKYFI